MVQSKEINFSSKVLAYLPTYYNGMGVSQLVRPFRSFIVEKRNIAEEFAKSHSIANQKAIFAMLVAMIPDCIRGETAASRYHLITRHGVDY